MWRVVQGREQKRLELILNHIMAAACTVYPKHSDAFVSLPGGDVLSVV